jgi:hypothetical protein
MMGSKARNTTTPLAPSRARLLFFGGLLTALPALSGAQIPVYVPIPVGTVVPVITLAELSSKTAKKGMKLELAVDGDVVIGGRVVITKGASIWGAITEAKKAGRFGNDGALAIGIDSVLTVDGKTVVLLADLRDTVPESAKKEGGLSESAKKAVSGIPGADVATGFFQRGDEIGFSPNARLRVVTASYTYVQLMDSVSEPVAPTPAPAPAADSAPAAESTDSVSSSSDSAATDQPKDSAAGGSRQSAVVTSGDAEADAIGLEPAVTLFDGIETWGRALGVMAAHLGSTPEVRALGARMEKAHLELQTEGAAFAAKKKIELSPLVPGDQEKLNETLKELRKLSGTEFDQSILQRIYGLGQNVTNAFQDASPSMEKLLTKAVAAWNEQMTTAAKLMAKK